jgi:hypothetical protein
MNRLTQPQQIALALDDRADAQRNLQLQPEQMDRLIELMAEAILALVRPHRRADDEQH